MKIVIPTDFSPLSDKALDAGIQLAMKLNAEVDIIHTIEINHVWEEVADFSKVEGMISGDYSYMHVAKKIAQKKLDAIQEIFEMNKIKANTIILNGKPHHRIVEYVKENKVDLLLMATHGADGLKEVFIGSNAQRIIRNITCPVLTVKEEDNVDFSSIVFASDFVEDEEEVLQYIKTFANYFNAKVTLLKVITPLVFTPDKEILESIATIANKIGFKDFQVEIIQSESVEEGITEYCEKNEVSLVTIATHGKGFFRKVFVSNTTEYLANHLDKPLLSIPFHF